MAARVSPNGDLPDTAALAENGQWALRWVQRDAMVARASLVATLEQLA